MSPLPSSGRPRSVPRASTAQVTGACRQALPARPASYQLPAGGRRDLEARPDVIGLGITELGVDVQGIPQVLTSPAGLAERFAGAADTRVGTGLLLAVSSIERYGERARMMVQRVCGLPGGLSRLAESVKRVRLLTAVACRPQQREGLLMVLGRLVRAAEGGLGVTEIGQGQRLPSPVPEFGEYAESLSEAPGRLRRLA